MSKGENMKRTEKLPELLAPAGNYESLLAAVEGGADAVYVGGKRFGARAFAKNFDIEELERAVTYCHLRGVKLYVTVNTLVLDLEMGELVEYAAELWRIGVDALIIADLGAIAEIRKYVPELELHASTQMSVHNTIAADEAYEMGCSRVVLARELSLDNIKRVTEGAKAEIEVFLHGALCVCHSGQCLFSSMVGGRSGNRGECAQPCRLPYNNGKYPLSLRDLSLSGHIKELVDSGVSSLKIEGRMKSPAYVYTVTSIYRRLLDECRDATEKENSELKTAFSRGGFTDGYLRGKPQSVELGMRSESDKEESRSVEREFLPIKTPVKAEVEIRVGQRAKMTLYNDKKRISVLGDIPNPAENAPLRAEDVKARLSKMGNTYLSLSPTDIDLSLDEGLNLAPSALNSLRRMAAAEFENCSRTEINVNYNLPKTEISEPFKTAVFLGSRDIPDVSSELSDFDAVFVPLMEESLPSFANGIYLPPIITDSELAAVEKKLSELPFDRIKYALVSNIGHLKIAEKYGLRIVCDFRLNVTNRVSKSVLKELGVEHMILSPEITLPQARDISAGVTVYGRIPLMLTERCFIKENFGCKNCGKSALTDRRGEKFPIIREFEHRNIILNSAVTYMGDKSGELSKNRISSHHFIFTTESGSQISEALTAFKKAIPLRSAAVRRVGRR